MVRREPMYYVISNELFHYGIKGMRWGFRKKMDTANGHKKDYTHKRLKKAVKVGAVIGVSLLATYGVYKLSKNPRAINKGRSYITNIIKNSKGNAKSVNDLTLALNNASRNVNNIQKSNSDLTARAIKARQDYYDLNSYSSYKKSMAARKAFQESLKNRR